MNDYIAAVLFFLPAGIANMVPVFANKIPILNRWKTPVDFGLSLNGRRILGNNKSWRGIISGTFVAGLVAIVISKFNANTVVTIPPFAAGCLLGFGALFGDAVESFFKRSMNIPPGQSWFPFDQLDYIVGGFVCILPFVTLPLWSIATVFVVYFGLHLVFAYAGYLLGFKDQPI